MSTVLDDLLNGTGALSAHSPDIGGAWTSASIVLTGSGAAVNSSPDVEESLVNAAAATTPNYTASADILPNSGGTKFLRFFLNDGFYKATFFPDGDVDIRDGSYSVLASASGISFNNGGAPMPVSVERTATQVILKVNGATVLTHSAADHYTPPTSTNITMRTLVLHRVTVVDAAVAGPVLSIPTVVSTGNTTATVRVTTDTPPTGSSILAVRTRPAGDPAWTEPEVLAAPTATITSGASGARDFNLTGLTNGTALAADFAQTGSNVVSTASFTPSTVPGAPTIGTATAGNAQATVAGTAPVSNGGSAITGYRSTATPGGSTVTGASLPITHTGLTNGTAYTFTLAAQNANGYGAESAASNSVTPSAGGDTTAPSITSTGTGGTNGPFTATVAENSTATFITFTSDEALASVTKAGANGGSYTLAGSGLTRTLARTTGFDYEEWVLAGSVPEVVTLAFADAAANVRNVTVNISPTNVNEPPSAPTIGTATAGDQTVSIAFTAPVNTGKPTITGYTATLSPGGITKTGASSPIVFGAGDGVVNDTAYTGVVKATNSEGTGPDSSSSNSVTPTAGAPTGATINSEPLGNNNNVLLPNTLLLWVGVRDFLTGTPVALHTNITTDSSAQFSLYDAALNVADRYLVDWVTESFEHGRAEAVGE